MSDKFNNTEDRVRILNDQYKWSIEKMRATPDILEKKVLGASAEVIGEEFFLAVAERNSFRIKPNR